jgi:prepilin-type N-terminal cleavage/methylation domain-containing protein
MNCRPPDVLKEIFWPAGKSCKYNVDSVFRDIPMMRSRGLFLLGRGFSLIELLVVMALIGLLVALTIPAMNSIKGAGNVTKAAYDIAGALEQARAYAMANNTYTWVGFFEEDASQPSATPATAGTGRLVLSFVASKDGSTVYTNVVSPAATIPPGGFVQIGKLIKIDNVHLKSAIADDPVFPIGKGTGATFDARPAVAWDTAKIGDTSPPDSLRPIQYPVGAATPAPTAQYTFKKLIQFNPLGEARVNNNNYSLKPAVEIGLQPSRGTVPDTNSKNVIAIQITGIAGRVNIYRP